MAEFCTPNPLPAATESRRSFLSRVALRGLGVSIALPVLDSLPGIRTARALAAEPMIPVRMAFLYVPNGVNLEHWRPTGVDRDFSLGRSLAPLQSLKNEVQLITGLAHRNGTGGPDGPGDHARATSTILTGVRPRKTAGADIRAGISVDQVAARGIGQHTRLPSLELSCDAVRKSGECDSGYSCAYSYNMSWRSANEPATAESNPRLVFERLFGAGNALERKASLQSRQEKQRSILDFVVSEARSLNTQLGSADKSKLDQYLTCLREIENQIIRVEQMGLPSVKDRSLPAKPPVAYSEHIRLMADMLVLAFQTDSTRIATFMLAFDGSNREFPEIGVNDGHHTLSHHEGNANKLEKIACIDHFYAEQLAYFLERLSAVKESDGGSLLDHSMIVYSSGISDGNKHRHDDLPVILAGRAGGQLSTGRHLQLPKEQPMSNLFLTMLDLIGAPEKQFGDATGPLDAVRA